MIRVALGYQPRVICKGHQRWLSGSLKGSNRWKTRSPINMADLERCFGCGSEFQALNPSLAGYLPDMVRRKEAHILGVPYEKYAATTATTTTPNIALPTSEEVHQLLCSRCHRLTYHHSLPSATNAQTDSNARTGASIVAEKIIHALQQSPNGGHVLAVCDILNLPGSLCLDMLCSVPAETPLTIAVNKVDLLPEHSNLDRIHWYVNELLVKQLDRKSPKLDIHLISAKSGDGVDKMVLQLFQRRYQSRRGGEDIYLVGKPNVGKSSLLNRWLSAYESRLGWRATESAMPGTTLDLIRHPLNQLPGLRAAVLAGKKKILHADSVTLSNDKRASSLFLPQRSAPPTSSSLSRLLSGQLVDTPGLENGWNENLADWLLADYPEELKMVQPTKRLQPESFLLRPGRSLWLGGMGRLDYCADPLKSGGATGDNSKHQLSDPQIIATVFRSPKIPLHTSSVEKADELLRTHLGGQQKYWPESIIIKPSKTNGIITRSTKVKRKNESKDLWSGVMMTPPIFSHPAQLLKRLSTETSEVDDPNSAVAETDRQRIKQLSLLTERKAAFPSFQLAKELTFPSTTDDFKNALPASDLDYAQQMHQLSPHSPQHYRRALVDIVFAGVGWISLSGNFFSEDGVRQARLQVHTPGGRGVYIRQPSMLPFDVIRRGSRVKSSGCDRYKSPTAQTIQSALKADKEWWLLKKTK